MKAKIDLAANRAAFNELKVPQENKWLRNMSNMFFCQAGF
ncbi:MAG: hypothetical protein ACJAWV_004244 [Flammeovirgaceae bacterium]|jgi:hypothetical protein